MINYYNFVTISHIYGRGTLFLFFLSDGGFFSGVEISNLLVFRQLLYWSKQRKVFDLHCRWCFGILRKRIKSQVYKLAVLHKIKFDQREFQVQHNFALFIGYWRSVFDTFWFDFFRLSAMSFWKTSYFQLLVWQVLTLELTTVWSLFSRRRYVFSSSISPK